MELRHRISILTLIILALSLLPSLAAAQCRVVGKVVDAADKTAMVGATIVITPDGDGRQRAVASGKDGGFVLEGVSQGRYELSVNFMGYEKASKSLDIRGKDDVNVGTIALKIASKELDEVRANAIVQRQEQRGDTTIFNAAAYKMSPDATTEDLIKKLPGMQVKNGTITHGGEEVKKVLVDGKEFFGSNTSAAIRNIDADMVDKIEVFDKQSEQSEFTGISDGNEERTINILTKTKITGGSFGQGYVGGGTDKHYEAGASANMMGQQNRVSIIAQANDIGQRGYEDSNAPGGGSAVGKRATAEAGINYVLDKKKGISIESSYSFNRTKSENECESHQEYFVEHEGETPRTYDSQSTSENTDFGHEINLRLRWDADTMNSVVLVPEWSWKQSDSENENGGQDSRGADTLRSTMRQAYNNGKQYRIGIDATIKHKFNKPQRTVALRLRYTTDRSTADASSLNNQTNANPTSSLTTGQVTDSKSQQTGVEAQITYTEPINNLMALIVSYFPRVTYSSNDKSVSADSTTEASLTPTLGNYRFSSLLSNVKDSRYTTHRAGLSLNIRKSSLLLVRLGVDFQDAILDGEQTYPLEIDTRRTFTSLMPHVDFRVGRRRRNNLMVSYRTSTSAPTINQLQDVVDVSNIRSYSGGDANLRQSYTHAIRISGTANDREAGRIVFIHANIRLTNDYIATASYMSEVDSVIEHGITLPAGTQYTKPVNMDGMVNAGVMLNASSPVKWLGSTLNLTMRADLKKVPGIYKGVKMQSRSCSLGGGLNVVSNLSENVDFNIGYDMTYNILRNSQASESNYNYYRHSIAADLRLNFFSQHLFFNNVVRHNMTNGMGDDFDTNNMTWDTALGGRFLKGKRGEVRLRVSDVLNQAQSRNRGVGTASVTTSTQSVVGRYGMLTFVYKFKEFSGEGGRRGFGGRPGGGPPPPPPGGF